MSYVGIDETQPANTRNGNSPLPPIIIFGKTIASVQASFVMYARGNKEPDISNLFGPAFFAYTIVHSTLI